MSLYNYKEFSMTFKNIILVAVMFFIICFGKQIFKNHMSCNRHTFRNLIGDKYSHVHVMCEQRTELPLAL